MANPPFEEAPEDYLALMQLLAGCELVMGETSGKRFAVDPDMFRALYDFLAT